MAPRQQLSSGRNKQSNTANGPASNAVDVNLRTFSAPRISQNLQPDSSEGAVLTLAEYQKRRAAERESALSTCAPVDSWLSTSNSDADLNRSTPHKNPTMNPSQKRKRRYQGTDLHMLSFGSDDENLDAAQYLSKTSGESKSDSLASQFERDSFLGRTRRANPAIVDPPKLKSGKASGYHTREIFIRNKERHLLEDQEKAEIIAIPFVFFEGRNEHGGIVTVKKGDTVDMFLDNARKGVNLFRGDNFHEQEGVPGSTVSLSKPIKDWSRVRLEDLLLVRSGIIIPQFYEFRYFISNHIQGYNGLLFDYTIGARSQHDARHTKTLQGTDHNPSLTKVVDRQWFERHRHVYPVTIWEYFDPSKDYSKSIRRDVHGNPFHSLNHVS